MHCNHNLGLSAPAAANTDLQSSELSEKVLFTHLPLRRPAEQEVNMSDSSQNSKTAPAPPPQVGPPSRPAALRDH
ncbi:unnamed protein product [Lota lota]